MDKKREHGKGLRLRTAGSAGKSHTMDKVCHYGGMMRIWGHEGSLDLKQVWSSSMMASHRRNPIVPNLVKAHRTKSNIKITPELLPLLKATL